jgi:hypothetical protein
MNRKLIRSAELIIPVEPVFAPLADPTELFESFNQIPPTLYYVRDINISPEFP